MNTRENQTPAGPRKNDSAPPSLRPPSSALRNSPAFTLIELLVVIAIIGVLAAMLLPTAGAIKATQLKKRAQTELARIETAIQNYHDAFGYYPPDNKNNLEIN